MRFQRRQFLQLAARCRRAPGHVPDRERASLSGAAGSPDHRLYARRLGGSDRAADGAVAVGDGSASPS